MISRKWPVLVCLVLTWGIIVTEVVAREVKVRLVGAGPNARYIEEGQTEQRPVSVDVGDTVIWANEGNLTHTATAENQRGNLLFDTGDIRSGTPGAPPPVSDPIQMTAALFANAGGQPGGSVLIEYFCDHHAQMQSSLVLNDPEVDAGVRSQRRGRMLRREGAGEAEGLRRRRDITSLNTGELNQYRDAWRRIQSDAGYRDLSGYHDCPREYCHRPGERIIFLPWHREYVLRMESLLAEPLHYWDWTSDESITDGIPQAFTDVTYVSADGNTYPNPLRAFRFTCPAGSSAQTTSRSPDPPVFLGSYAASVQSSYASPSYSGFNSAIEGPHGSLHVWVGGQMGNTTYAAYDPLFWAHHSNVDRQWASWQRGGGPDPSAGDLSRPLTGFPGRTVDDVKSIAPLGYEYDRYDSMPSGPFAPLELVALAGESRSLAAVRAGVGKTFSVSGVERALAAVHDNAPPLHLYVGGIPDHVVESYFVYVFVNQPDATPDDANPANPKFAGTFGLFGTGRERERSARHEPAAPKRVMQLFAGQKTRPREPISQVTLVVTQGRSVIAHDDIPFTSASIREATGTQENGARVAVRAPGFGGQRAGAEEFVGTSRQESYDEAYRDAVNQAQARLAAGMPDGIIAVEVLSVAGRRGGIAGLRRMTVKIRAWRE